MALKKVLNRHEEVTHRRLREACEKWDASVFAKVRLADILPIEGSGIDPGQYAYALRSHFDFVVTDVDHNPLFAVEFDGPGHESPKQAHRDKLKNDLCEHFEFPLLRINARYLTKTYGTMDLLTWFVDLWFLARGFQEAQELGHIPWDESFDHQFLMWGDRREPRFPWWLSAALSEELRTLSDQGRCWVSWSFLDRGKDSQGNYRTFGFLRITGDTGVSAATAMRSQLFPAPIDALLGDIVSHELYQRVLAVLKGTEPAESVISIRQKIAHFRDSYEFMGGSYTSRGEPLEV